MGRYRSSLQITADVLSVTANGAKKVEIMFKANLSYKLLSQYLNKLVGAALVSFEGSAGCYRLTRKGKEFLDRFGEYSRLCKKLDNHFDDVNNEKTALKRMIDSGFVDESKQ